MIDSSDNRNALGRALFDRHGAKKMTQTNLWGGRFQKPPAEALKRFNDSISFDINLVEEDIAGSVAWAQALGSAHVITAAETEIILGALHEIQIEHRTSGFADFGNQEDVHSFVEARLAETIGPLAGRLHTGRSRNDQVATDLRLWLCQAVRTARNHTVDVAEVLAIHAQAEAGTPMPGYTHLQQAEVITFGHWCMAYVAMLMRDVDRFDSLLKRADECPLGSGALAGTPLDLDRHRLARALGFDRPTENSLDAVSDRDTAVEYLFAVTLLFSHVSRLAEDLIIYSTQEFGFVELPDEYATGSSRMPQKKNPDVLELVRGHAGRLIGELTGLLALLKGLPLAYNKDLQLDKEPLFRTAALLNDAMPALAGLLSGLKVHQEVMYEKASSDSLLATEISDSMAARGVPFREAHEIVSKRVAEAAKLKMSLRDLGPSVAITERDLRALDVDLALSRKTSFGGSAPWRVRAAAKEAKTKIAVLRGAAQLVQDESRTAAQAPEAMRSGMDRADENSFSTEGGQTP